MKFNYYVKGFSILMVYIALITLHPVFAHQKTACTGTNNQSLCIIVKGTSSPAVLTQTRDKGKSWFNRSIVTDKDTETFIDSVSCTGSGETAFCVGSGDHRIPSVASFPLLIQTQNGGKNWEIVYQNMENAGTFKSLTCSENNSQTSCMAAGWDKSPLIYRTTDTGKSWKRIDLSSNGVQSTGWVQGISCTKSGSFCAALIANDLGKYRIFQTTDYGQTWIEKSIISSSNNYLSEITCVGEGLNTSCFAIGYYNYPNFKPYLVRTVNQGKTWDQVVLNGFSDGSEFTSVDCTEQQNDPVYSPSFCVALGWDKNLESIGAHSSDGGKTWQVQNIPSPAEGFIYVNCHHTYKANFCIGAGFSSQMIKSENGLVWRIKTIDSFSDNYIYNTSCTQDGYCVAGGHNEIAQSINFGETWSSVRNYDTKKAFAQKVLHHK